MHLPCTCSLLVAGALLPAITTHAARPTDAASREVNASVGVTTSALIALDVAAAPGEPTTVVVPIEGRDYTVDFVPHSVRAPGYRLIAQVEGGAYVDLEPGAERTLRGVVLETPGGTAAGSLEPDGLAFMVQLPDVEGRHWIEPASRHMAGAAANAYVLYHDRDRLSPGTCGVDHLTPDPVAVGDGGVAGESCLRIAEIAFDADHEYYLDRGSSVPATESRILGNLNLMDVQYTNQCNITHQATTILVRTDVDDPYSGNTMSSRLGEFQSHWNSQQQGISRDLAELYTGLELSGSVIGQAVTIGGICNAAAYNICEDLGSLAFRADLAAHECGHLWDSQHCQISIGSSCAGTMNSGLTGALFFIQASVDQITAYRDTRTFCLPCAIPNDECSGAAPAATGTTNFNNATAGTDGFAETICTFDGENDIDADLWYEYQAPCNGEVTIDTCGSGFDTKLAVYAICPNGANQALACDDDSGCGTSSSITLDINAGMVYWVRVGGFAGATGDGVLNIAEAVCDLPAPSNDNCGSAQALSAGTTAFTTIGATTDGPDEPGSSCDTGGSSNVTNDVWYRLVSGCDELITISTCNADFDTRLAVYGSSCPTTPGTVVACNDDACGLQSEVTFDASGGGIFRLRLGGFDGATGSGDIVVTCEAGEPSCPGDANGDDTVNVDDLNAVILDWGTDGSANGGDLTGQTPGSGPDGSVDVNDLNAVIVNWGDCP